MGILPNGYLELSFEIPLINENQKRRDFQESKKRKEIRKYQYWKKRSKFRKIKDISNRCFLLNVCARMRTHV